VGCAPQPRTAEVLPHEDGELDRLHKENVRLEERLRDVQSERDAQKAALDRCQGRAEPGAPIDVAAAPSARRQLPVVRLVPDAAHSPNDGVPKSEERVILRATGDGEGEIAPAPKEVDSPEISSDTGVRLSDPDGSPSSSARAPAERPAR
jgi:hypothetical protein